MKEFFLNIFEYDCWANEEIVKCLQSISGPPEKALSIMSHIIDAQELWLCRMKYETPEITVWQTYSNSDILSVLKKYSGKFNEYLNTLPDKELQKVIQYKNTKGEEFNSTIEDILIHLSHHSAYHRAQIILLIKPLVTELPYTDYIHYIRSVKK